MKERYKSLVSAFFVLFSSGVLGLAQESSPENYCEQLPRTRQHSLEGPSHELREEWGVEAVQSRTPEQLVVDILSIFQNPVDTASLYEHQDYRITVSLETVSGVEEYDYVYDPDAVRFVQLTVDKERTTSQEMPAASLSSYIFSRANEAQLKVHITGTFNSEDTHPASFVEPSPFISTEGGLKDDPPVEGGSQYIEEATIGWHNEGVSVSFQAGTRIALASGASQVIALVLRSEDSNIVAYRRIENRNSFGHLDATKEEPYFDQRRPVLFPYGMQIGSAVLGLTPRFRIPTEYIPTPACT